MNKTDFLAATKCITMAWHQTRCKSLPLDEAVKFKIDQRREIGELARQLFPDGILIHGDNERGIADTQRLIGDGATKTIFEAAFISGAFTAKVDVLNRGGGGWDVIKVKPSLSTSTKVKKEYVDDLAYTVMVLRRAGITVMRARLLLLSKEYRYGDRVDQLFTFLDKTDKVDARRKVFEADVEAIAGAVVAEQVPEPVLSSACRNCDFRDRVCLGSGHEHTVLELPGLHHTKLQKLSAAGVINITDVPASFELNPTQQRVRDAAESGQLFVDQDLGQALAGIEWPCHYLDFETMFLAMPLYPGHGCYRHVLTQFSVHHRDSLDAAPRHSEFLADAAESQERLLAERLIEVLGTEGSIIVYTTFESTRIKDLIKEFPDLAGQLNAIRARLVDFKKIVEKHVYHPAFAGSFSLKKIVPALVPDISYKGLDVADGENAVALFARMARGEIEAVAEAREHLLAYCKTDTLVMVRLHKILADMAA